GHRICSDVELTHRALYGHSEPERSCLFFSSFLIIEIPVILHISGNSLRIDLLAGIGIQIFYNRFRLGKITSEPFEYLRNLQTTFSHLISGSIIDKLVCLLRSEERRVGKEV